MLKSILVAAAAAFLIMPLANAPASAQAPEVILHAELVIVPSALPKFLELLKVNAAATIADPGAIAFNVAQQPSNPNHIVIYEVYENKAALDYHNASGHFKKFLASVKGMIADHTLDTLAPVAIHMKAR